MSDAYWGGILPDVITLGEPLVEFIDKHRRGSFTQLSEFIGPFPSGAPAIFTVAVARLKVSSGLVGVVGKDEFGTLLLDRLRTDGVDISHMRVAEGYTTGTAFVTYSPSGSRKFIFHLRHAAAGQLSPEDVDDAFIKSAKFLHIMGSALSLSQSSKEACYKALEIAVKHGVKVSLDPNVRPELLSIEEIRRICKPVIENAYLVLPSGEEAMMLTGGKTPDEACKILIDMGVKIVALKRGAEGSTIYTEGEVLPIPAFKVEEVEPTGAGDIYDGAFIVGLVREWPLSKVGLFANAAGAISVTRIGPIDSCPYLEEVERLISTGRL